MLNSPYITFSDALDKWAKQAQFIEDSFSEIRDKAIEAYKNLRDVSFSDYGYLSYLFDKFYKDVNSEKGIAFRIYIKETTKYAQITNDFLNGLLLNQVDCFLLDLNYIHKKTPYPIFYYKRKEIIQSNGYVNIDNIRHHICFEKNVFEAFLFSERQNYRTITVMQDSLDRGNDIPEFRALKIALEWPLEEIKALHGEKHDPSKQESKLVEKLRALTEPPLKDEWARNLATLLNKMTK